MEHVPNENACKNYEDWSYLPCVFCTKTSSFIYIAIEYWKICLICRDVERYPMAETI